MPTDQSQSKLEKKKTKDLLEIILKEQYNYTAADLKLIREILLSRQVSIEEIEKHDSIYNAAMERDRIHMGQSNIKWLTRIIAVIIGCLIYGAIKTCNG